MIKRFIIIVAFFTTALMAAQEGTSSPYSYYGIGVPKFKGTVENQAMGGLMLFSDSIHLNLQNPAGYGRLRLTTFTVGGSHQRTQLKTDEASERNQNTSLDYLAVGVPTGKLNFGFGILPATAVGYRVLDVNEETANRFTGRGGMNKVFLTAGYAINNNLSVGVDANYNFGNLQNSFTAVQNGVELGTRRINRTDISGFNFNLGVDYQKRIANGLKLFTAATYSPATDVSTDRMRNTATILFAPDGREIVNSESNVELPERDLTLPGKYTLGLGLGGTNKWFLGAEYTGLQASEFNFDSGRTNQNYQYKDATQFRLGGFYIPQYNSLTSYFSRIVYRAGVRYEETGLHLNNESVNEFGISFGLGLPAGTSFSNANIGMEYGQRGTTASGLIQENFFKFTVSLSLSDRWFQQRRFD